VSRLVRTCLAGAVGVVALSGALVLRAPAATAPIERRGGAPVHLSDTGLYSDFARGIVAPGVLPYVPQYPLWTDGATKRRWISLPPGTSIDASDPDAWVFPVGTKIWKEFSFGRKVETRTMERAADGSWIYATYAWSEDGQEALLAPDRGIHGACESRPGIGHDIPSTSDCRACHQGRTTEVLGFDALQLSSDRDPLAPHAELPPEDAVDLPALVERGLVRGLPQGVLAEAPRIVARTPRERAVLGYLHGNCGSCHNSRGPLANLGLELDYRIAADPGSPARAIATAVGIESRFRLDPDASHSRISPGSPDSSVLYRRIASRNKFVQMPALGTHALDEQAVALVEDWIREDLVLPTSASTPHPSVNVSHSNRKDSSR